MAESQYPPLVVIVGPTAVGKTEIAVALAQALDGGIVSADSRQVYRLMDIGTAKPTLDEMSRVCHYLVDILEPDEQLTLAEFQARAFAAIDDLLAQGRLPLLVGGTGQYVRAVVQGWGIPQVPPAPALRADLESFSQVYSPIALYAWLTKIDPDAARRVDRRNVRRVVRALEVYLVTGQGMTSQQYRMAPPYRILQIGLTRSRRSLYARADARVDRMMELGLLDEVRKLLSAGYGWELPSMNSLGYVQLSTYLRGDASLEGAIAAIKRETRCFIRRQYTWFRLDNPDIVWFDLDKVLCSKILTTIKHWLGRDKVVMDDSSR